MNPAKLLNQMGIHLESSLLESIREVSMRIHDPYLQCAVSLGSRPSALLLGSTSEHFSTAGGPPAILGGIMSSFGTLFKAGLDDWIG